MFQLSLDKVQCANTNSVLMRIQMYSKNIAFEYAMKYVHTVMSIDLVFNNFLA